MLPTSRNRTYTGASSIVPGDLDDIQDCIIGAKHGDIPITCNSIGNTEFTANWTPNLAGAYMVSTGAGVLMFSPRLIQGDILKSVTFAKFGDGAADLGVAVYKVTAGGVVVRLDLTATINDVAAAWSDTTIVFDPYTLLAREAILVEFNANAANLRIGNITHVKSHP